MMAQIETIDFHTDTLIGAHDAKGDPHVAMRPIVDNMGLDWPSQRKRLLRDPVLSQGVVMMTTPSEGGTQNTLCLRLDLLPGWLATINANRIKREEVREKVIRYQRECYAVLARHFFGAAEAEPQRVDFDDIDRMPSWMEAKSLVTEARHSFNKRSARQMWFRMGLPIVPAMYEIDRQGELFHLTPIDGGKV